MQMKPFTFQWASSADKIGLTLCAPVCEGMPFSKHPLRFLHHYNAATQKRHHSIAALSFLKYYHWSHSFSLCCRVNTLNIIPCFWSSSHPGKRHLKRTNAFSSACTSECHSNNGNWAWRDTMRLTQISPWSHIMILCTSICRPGKQLHETKANWIQFLCSSSPHAHSYALLLHSKNKTFSVFLLFLLKKLLTFLQLHVIYTEHGDHRCKTIELSTWGSASLKVIKFQENDQILCH